MKYNSLLSILVLSFLGTACDNEQLDHASNFEFETIDKENNQIHLEVTIRYRLKSRLDKRLSRKYGRHYADSLFLPAILSVSNNVLNDYSAGEIYNYKRDEIVEKLDEQTKTTFAPNEIEITAFLIRGVTLSDAVMRRFEKEHVILFENAMNSCRKETKGVVTDIHVASVDDLVAYEFNIGNKNYEGFLNQQEVSAKLSVGDSLVIEYACEDPASFHRIKN